MRVLGNECMDSGGKEICCISDKRNTQSNKNLVVQCKSDFFLKSRDVCLLFNVKVKSVSAAFNR